MKKIPQKLTAAKKKHKDALEGAAIDKAVENAEIVELPRRNDLKKFTVQ